MNELKQKLSNVMIRDRILAIPIEVINNYMLTNAVYEKDSSFNKYIIQGNIEYIVENDMSLIAYKAFNDVILRFNYLHYNKEDDIQATSGVYAIRSTMEKGDKIILLKGSKIELYCIENNANIFYED